MPQLIVRYWPPVMTVGPLRLYGKGCFTDAELYRIGRFVRPIVADACSIDGGPQLTKHDVEWLPQPFHRASLGTLPFEIELRTIGFPARKAKLNEAGTRELKQRISFHLPIRVTENMGMSSWLWVQWIDPDGFHV